MVSKRPEGRDGVFFICISHNRKPNALMLASVYTAVVTHYHELNGLNQQKIYYLLVLRAQETEMGLTRLKARGQQSCAPRGGPGKNLFLVLSSL